MVHRIMNYFTHVVGGTRCFEFFRRSLGCQLDIQILQNYRDVRMAANFDDLQDYYYRIRYGLTRYRIPNNYNHYR